METTTNQPDKSTLITVLNGTEELLMKVIQHHQLSYEVLGYDQSNSAILKINYSEENEHAVKEIGELIKFLETFAVILELTLISVCQQLKEVKNIQDLKTIFHGNEKRK